MNLYRKVFIGKATLADQDEALKNSECAYYFAKNTPGADIYKCQEVVCKNPYFAYLFALNIPGADVGICQEAVCKHPHWAFYFARFVPNANIESGLEACKGTVYEDRLNEYVMNKALV